MHSFKFSCPDCSLHIETDASSAGRIIKCPQCTEELVVPAFNPKASIMPIALHSKHTRPKVSKSPEAATTGTKSQIVKAQMPDQVGGDQGVKKVPEHKPVKPHVGNLSANIKLEVVRWAYRRIENAKSWMPHAKRGTHYVYAGIPSNGDIVQVSYDHVDAQRFTLLGAILLELKIQNVSMAAEGREAFLDKEIVSASRQILEKESVVLEEAQDPIATLTHEQCLSVLRQLESEYIKAREHLDDMLETARLPGVTMLELVKRAEQGTIVTSNEVLSVLYHEIHILNRRVEELEKLIKTRI